MATDGKVTFWDAASGAPTFNAQELRQLDSPLLMPGPASAPFSGRSGRQVNNSGLAVTVDSTGAGSVTVSPGAGVIYDPAYATQGAWRCSIPTAKTVALAARPGSGTSRIDLVVLRIYDSALAGAGAVKELKVEVVTGAAAATPSAPTLPPLSLLLSTLTVSSTSGAAIGKTDTTAVSVAAGGILPVATTAEMDKLKTDGIAYRGLVVDNAQTGLLHRYNGTAWVQMAERQVYSTITGATVASSNPPPADAVLIRKIQYHGETTASNGTVAKNFTSPFPNGVLHLTATTVAGASMNPVINAGSITKTGVTLVWPGVNNTFLTFTFEAVGW